MRLRSGLIVAAITAAAVLALATTASARRFSFSNQSYVELWSPLIFRAEGGISISCPVTIGASFHSATIPKVNGLIGYVYESKVATASCTGGRYRFDTETLPWHTIYLGFEGRLPAITSLYIKFIHLTFDWEAGGLRCRTETTATEPTVTGFNLEAEAGGSRVARTIRAVETDTITLGGSFLCEFAGRGDFAGTGEVFAQSPPATRILIRLVQ
jgi:hypothetical protein